MYNKLLYGTISSRGKEAVRRPPHRLSSKPLATPFLQIRSVVVRPKPEPILRNEFPLTKPAFNTDFIRDTRGFRTHSSARTREAGAQVLHQPAREVYPGEIGSARVDKVIDDMVKVMRKQLAVGLCAPQIGVPLRIIVLEVTKLHIALSPNEDNEEQDRRPFDLLVTLNPRLKEEQQNGIVFRRLCKFVWVRSNGGKIPRGRGHRVGSIWAANKGRCLRVAGSYFTTRM
nr:peptide deformylase 1A, chloroplastic/mitochondrial [Tanacetum cinerariifolium]